MYYLLPSYKRIIQMIKHEYIKKSIVKSVSMRSFGQLYHVYFSLSAYLERAGLLFNFQGCNLGLVTLLVYAIRTHMPPVCILRS